MQVWTGTDCRSVNGDIGSLVFKAGVDAVCKAVSSVGLGVRCCGDRITSTTTSSKTSFTTFTSNLSTTKIFHSTTVAIDDDVGEVDGEDSQSSFTTSTVTATLIEMEDLGEADNDDLYDGESVTTTATSSTVSSKGTSQADTTTTLLNSPLVCFNTVLLPEGGGCTCKANCSMCGFYLGHPQGQLKAIFCRQILISYWMTALIMLRV